MKSRRMGLRLITKARLRRKDREIKQAWLCYRAANLHSHATRSVRDLRECLKRFAVRHLGTGSQPQYTEKVLTNWDKERGLGSTKDTSAIMVPTTHNLTHTQIAAIAAYVSNLK
jgi:hypothetical protein